MGELLNLLVESPVNGGFPSHLSERTREAMLCKNVFRPTNEGTYPLVMTNIAMV